MEKKKRKVFEKKVLFEIDDKFRIVAYDARNLQVQEKRDFYKKGVLVKHDWDTKAEAFYGSMRGALYGLVNKNLRRATITSLKEIIGMIDKLNTRIDKLECV